MGAHKLWVMRGKSARNREKGLWTKVLAEEEEENLAVQKSIWNISLTTREGKRDSKKAKNWGNDSGGEQRAGKLADGKAGQKLWQKSVRRERKGRTHEEWGQQPTLRKRHNVSHNEGRYLQGLKCHLHYVDFVICTQSLLEKQKIKQWFLAIWQTGKSIHFGEVKTSFLSFSHLSQMFQHPLFGKWKFIPRVTWKRLAVALFKFCISAMLVAVSQI